MHYEMFKSSGYHGYHFFGLIRGSICREIGLILVSTFPTSRPIALELSVA